MKSSAPRSDRKTRQRLHHGVLRWIRRSSELTVNLTLVCLLQMVAGEGWAEELQRGALVRKDPGEPSVFSTVADNVIEVSRSAWERGTETFASWAPSSQAPPSAEEPTTGRSTLLADVGPNGHVPAPLADVGAHGRAPAPRGNAERKKARAIPPLPQPPSGFAPLSPGFGAPPWRLLSVPDEPDNVDPADVLSTIAADFTLAYAYDACDPVSPWRVYDPADLPGSDLAAVDHRIGFWLKGTDPDPLAVSGTEPAETPIRLCPGWNLIGYPLAQDRPVLAALSSVIGKFLRVYGFDPDDEVEPWKVYDVDVPDWANTLHVMERGKGYWIYATEETTLFMRNVGPPPDVDITSPEEAATVTFLTAVTGTVTSDLLERWELAFRRKGETVWRPFASGVVPVFDDLLGYFDTTSLINGLYEIRLEATDFSNQTTSVVINVAVVGAAKIGQFILPLLDMTVPVVGVPLDVVRTYDSRDKNVGDFGFGWRLGLSQFQVQENRIPGIDWRGTRTGIIIPTYCIEPTESHIVTVTFPDGDVARFVPTVEPRCQLAAPPQVVTLKYEPARGTVAKLEPLDVSQEQLLVVGSFPGSVQLWSQDITNIHDPQTYRLTQADGTEFVIDEENGLQTITDRNGNVLTVSPSGINHSNGTGITFERDAQERISRIIDPAGKTMTYEYDAGGDLVRVIDREQQLWRFVYLEDHYLDKIIDPSGQERIAFEYDGENRWTGTCDTENHCTRLVHDLNANREVLQDATGRQVSYTYNQFGDILTVTDGLGNITRFDYDDLRYLVRRTDPDGGVTELRYDDRGNLAERIDPHPTDAPAAEFTTTYEFDGGDRVTLVRYPTGAEYRMTYDARGNLLRQEDEGGKVLLEFTYGPSGEIKSETTPFRRVVLGNHDALGNPRTETDSFGVTSTFQYDSGGKMLAMSDRDLNATFTYDALGRETLTQFDTGVELQSTYGLDDFPLVMEGPTFGHQERLLSSTGRLRGWREPGGATTHFEADAAGRLTAVVGPAGSRTQLAYDAVGRLSSYTDGRGGTESFEYDGMGRVIRTADGEGGERSFSYDLAGRPVAVTDARGKRWEVSYTGSDTTVVDPVGRETVFHLSPRGLLTGVDLPGGVSTHASFLLSDSIEAADDFPVSIVDAGGRERAFTYDDVANLTSVTDLAGAVYTVNMEPRRRQILAITGPTGRSRSFSYDSAGRLASTTYADGGVATMEYGPDFKLRRKTKPSGTTLDYTYDGAFRLTGVAASDGLTTGFEWRGDGALLMTTDGTGNTSYEYDAAGGLAAVSFPDGANVHYQRDLAGRITEIATRESAAGPARVTAYSYDAAGNVVLVVDPLGGQTTFAYDAVGRLVTRRLPNGVTTSYEYNLRDQVLSIEHRTGSGQLLRSITCERAVGGEPIRITWDDGTWVDLEYDSGLRLTREVYHEADGVVNRETSYGYDAAGNRTTVTTDGVTETYSYGAGHRVVEVTSPAEVERYSYDDDGRVTAISRDGRTLDLTYDSLDQLRRIAEGGDDVATYEWDASGRRARSSSRHEIVAPGNTESLEQRHAVSDAAGNLIAGFSYVGDLPLVRYDADGATYYLTDAMGSVIGLTNSAGNLVADFRYDSFGNLLVASGPGAAPDAQLGGDYRFHGGWWEPDSGLYHFHARFYDPNLGRFLTRDRAGVTVERPETLNGYAFALSNPHVFSDRSGFFSVMEINITMSIQDIIQTIKTAAVNYAKQTAKEKIGQAISDILVRLLESILPLQGGLAAQVLAAALSPSGQGGLFERLFNALLCEVIERYVPTALNMLYIEVNVSSVTGQALNDGLFRCGNTGPGPTGGSIKIDPATGSQSSRPDLIFSSVRPSKATGGFIGANKTFLIGDLKRSATAIGSNRNQFLAMMKHASNYGYHLAIFFTIRSGTGWSWRWAQEQAAIHLVKVFVISLS